MSTLSTRMAASLIALFGVPLLGLACLSSLEIPGFGMLGLYLLLVLFGAPVFLLLAPACSVIIEQLLFRLLELRNRYAAAGARLVLFALAGMAVGGMYAFLATGGSPAGFGGSPAAAGAAALVSYDLITLAVLGIQLQRHNARYGRPIETERLRLVPLSPRVYKQARAQGYPFQNHVEAYMEHLRVNPFLLGWGVWLVQLKETGEWIGDSGFKGGPDRTGTVDLGYGFLPHVWGRGYATETAKALVRWAFENGARRVTAETLRDNVASIRVLKKTGFELYREADHYYWQICLANCARPTSIS